MQQLSDYIAYHFHISFSIDQLPKTIRGKSLIRYPEVLKGKELFYFNEPANYKLPLSNWQKLLNILRLGKYGKKWRMELTSEVREFLNHS